jgi:hypothetical protein
MLPLEGPNGVLPRGLFPNLVKGGDVNQGWHSGFVADSLARTLLTPTTRCRRRTW